MNQPDPRRHITPGYHERVGIAWAAVRAQPPRYQREKLAFTVDYGLGHGLQPTSYLEIQATLKTNGVGGIVFDEYATNNFKFVALDVAAQKVLIGHVDPKRGWVVDASVARTLAANTDYSVQLVIKGSAVSVTVGGALLVSHAFNGPAVDGAVGVLARNGTTSFDLFRIRTDDPAFAAPPAAAGEGEPSLAPSAAAAIQGGFTYPDSRDVNRDGVVTPLDALMVINYLNSIGSAEGPDGRNAVLEPYVWWRRRPWKRDARRRSMQIFFR